MPGDAPRADVEPRADDDEIVLAAPLHPRGQIYQAKLTHWAKYAAARFNAEVYLVGSALTTDDPRDVDLRIIMRYDAYWARFGRTADGSRSWTWVREVAKLTDYATRDLAGEGNYCHSVDVQIENHVAAIAHKDKERVLLASPSVSAAFQMGKAAELPEDVARIVAQCRKWAGLDPEKHLTDVGRAVLDLYVRLAQADARADLLAAQRDKAERERDAAATARVGCTTCRTEQRPRELHCQRCHRDYPVWFAPNALWNEVAWDNEDFLCLDCFALLAEERTGRKPVWMLTEENVELSAALEEKRQLRDRLAHLEEACDLSSQQAQMWERDHAVRGEATEQVVGWLVEAGYTGEDTLAVLGHVRTLIERVAAMQPVVECARRLAQSKYQFCSDEPGDNDALDLVIAITEFDKAYPPPAPREG